MKPVRLIITAALALFSTALFAKEKTDSFKVYGNCDMCKKRIEKATQVEGISKANWNVETKIMTVTYDDSKITGDEIQKKIAAVGHDTEKFAAADDVYESLPECCLYERKKKTPAEAKPHQH